MTISIGLRKQLYHLESRTSSKISLAYEILNFYDAYFDPSRIEIWSEAPNEALGGQRRTQIECREKSRVKDVLMQALDIVRKDRDLLESMILMMRGVWTISGLKVPGYICVNNEESSVKTYGDIEVGAYSRGEVTDIIDLFWMDSTLTRHLVNDFLSRFSKFYDESHSVNYIVFGIGAPLVQPVTEWSASYHRRPTDFLYKVLSTMKKEPRIGVSSYLRLIYTRGIAAELYKIENFKKTLERIAYRNSVELDARSSLKLVGKYQDSYKNMINDLMIFLGPVFKSSLPEDQTITKRMADEINRQSSLD